MLRKTICVLFILILIFSSSVATLATESDTWKQAVKATAEADARRDTNIGLYYGIGLGTCAACSLGGYLGYRIAYHGYPAKGNPPLRYGNFALPSSQDKKCLGSGCTIPSALRFLGRFGGASACSGLVVFAASRMTIHPPWKRLMGKSPEYVAYYTAAYTQHTMDIQILSGAAGVATVIGGALLVWYLGGPDLYDYGL